jgi:crotonobetainyl-CoA:carnitine CoA-transferase CaiB-like acyl-CoA transferase
MVEDDPLAGREVREEYQGHSASAVNPPPGVQEGQGVLSGIRVLDLSTILAGPFAAMLLSDFGAEVIKIEHPRGDPLRTHGPQKLGHGLWWKQLNRNKACVTLNLSTPRGQELLRQLAEGADVLIENFRPGVLERWGLDPEGLREKNRGLVVLRITAFGQKGPYAHRPGFGTLAEAMSGFAAMTGWPDRPPTLPPFGLADGIAGLAGAFLITAALRKRDISKVGEVIDLSIIEPILMVLGAQATVFDATGKVPLRSGNRSVNNAPRNTYLTSDGHWVAVSTSATTVAERVMALVGRGDLVAEPWFENGGERARRADLLDEVVGTWIKARDCDTVLKAFDAVGAAAAPIYDIRDIVSDPQLDARGTLLRVADPDLGTVLMQNVIARLERSPGRVAWPGRGLGADNEAVFGGLGVTSAELVELHEGGVI